MNRPDSPLEPLARTAPLRPGPVSTSQGLVQLHGQRQGGTIELFGPELVLEPGGARVQDGSRVMGPNW